MNLQTRLTPFQPFLGIVGNKNWFPSSFEQILKLRILASILADFPLENPPRSPLTHSVNLILGIWFPYTQRQLDSSGWGTKNEHCFLWDTLMDSL